MKKGHATGTECLIDVWSYAWEQWLAESWRILRFPSFTGKARQKFPSKIGYSRSSKRFVHACTVGLSPKNSALEVGIVKNVKFNDDLAHFF